jgi:large subunit ribosomal protein L18
MDTQYKTKKRQRRHARIRSKVSGSSRKPRLAVYKSNQYLHIQLIDDVKGHTLAHVTSKSVKGKNKTTEAEAAGKKIAQQAKEQKVEHVVFDRGGFLYAGRIKAFAESARKEGLVF